MNKLYRNSTYLTVAESISILSHCKVLPRAGNSSINIHLTFPAWQHNTNTCSSAEPALVTGITRLIIYPSPAAHVPSPKACDHSPCSPKGGCHPIVCVRSTEAEVSLFSLLPVACFQTCACCLLPDCVNPSMWCSSCCSHRSRSIPPFLCVGETVSSNSSGNKDYFLLRSSFR